MENKTPYDAASVAPDSLTAITTQTDVQSPTDDARTPAMGYNRLLLTFPGKPKAVQSMKIAKIGNFIRKYQPKDVVEWKNYIRIQAAQQLPPGFAMFDGVPVIVWAKFCYSSPKNLLKADRLHISSGGEIWKLTRPDVTDNLMKGVIDSLTGIVWRDDSMVVVSHAEKVLGLSDYTSLEIRQIGRYVERKEVQK